ncbi:leucine-rich repeat-containing protein 51-like [Diorhabda sublineata]|uniref:leucine-rich repeat-containing protein 51-like n=1 Tax=Diorhabda sublineata TaxID=1163346 RepID=UPI0024E08391|nr:leucine-rich repeat-containing protein 51-like [Diorhabda sublineata]
MGVDHEDMLRAGKPADFSFRRLTYIDVAKFLETVGLEGARFTRVAGVPGKGEKKKFLTRSIWLNNNQLRSITNMDILTEAVLEYPDQLGWIDFSFNRISEIDECITKFKYLKIVYFHGNCISDLDEVKKLKPLSNLRSVTFHGNPISNHPQYRSFVIAILPQLANLDFTPILANEKKFVQPSDLIRKKEKKNAK